jgi:hypothetical protein
VGWDGKGKSIISTLRRLLNFENGSGR